MFCIYVCSCVCVPPADDDVDTVREFIAHAQPLLGPKHAQLVSARCGRCRLLFSLRCDSIVHAPCSRTHPKHAPPLPTVPQPLQWHCPHMSRNTRKGRGFVVKATVAMCAGA